jgi:hypothetical protein
MKKNRLFKGFLSAGVFFGIIAIVTMLLTLNTGNVILNNQINIETRSMHEINLDWLGGYPGATNTSGVNESFIYPHQTTGSTSYNVNISNSTAYAYTGTNNTHAGSNVPYSTAFDIVVMVRWNMTHAWDGTAFNSTYTRAYCNCSGLSISSVQMTQQLIGYDAMYVWYNYYLNNTAAGYTISKGQNVTSCSFNFEAYY